MSADTNISGNPYLRTGSEKTTDASTVDSHLVPNNSYLSMDVSLLLTCRGCSHLYLKQYQNALEDFNSAIKQNPKNPSAHLHRGKYHALLKKYKEAIIDFDAAISLNPEDPEVYLCRGEVKEKLELDCRQDFVKAGMLCYQVHSRHGHVMHNRPNGVRPRMLWCLALYSFYNIKQYELAVSCMDEAIIFEPSNVEYLELREQCRQRLNWVLVTKKDQGNQDKVVYSSGQAFSPESKQNSLAAPSEREPSQYTGNLGQDPAPPVPTKSLRAIIKRNARTTIINKDDSPSMPMTNSDKKSTPSRIPAGHTIKIGMQGKKGCGKSTLIRQFCNPDDSTGGDKKDPNYEWKKIVEIDGKVYELLIYQNDDLGNCDCIIVLADVKAFLNHETWSYFNILYKNNAELLNNRPLIFAGTKCENVAGELWSLEDFFLMQKPCDYAIMTSALNNVNVTELFFSAARKTIELRGRPQIFSERHLATSEHPDLDDRQDKYSPLRGSN